MKPNSASILVLFQDLRPLYVRHDQKFLNYKNNSVERKFEYMEEVEKMLHHRKTNECIHAAHRISSILGACQKSLDVIFEYGQARFNDCRMYHDLQETSESNNAHTNYKHPKISSDDASEGMIIMVQSALLDCKNVIDDLGVLPFLYFGEFVLRRLILNWEMVQPPDSEKECGKDDPNVDHNLTIAFQSVLTGKGKL